MRFKSIDATSSLLKATVKPGRSAAVHASRSEHARDLPVRVMRCIFIWKTLEHSETRAFLPLLAYQHPRRYGVSFFLHSLVLFFSFVKHRCVAGALNNAIDRGDRRRGVGVRRSGAFIELQSGWLLALWPRKSIAQDSGIAVGSPSPTESPLKLAQSGVVARVSAFHFTR
jgi:hypothetical protein